MWEGSYWQGQFFQAYYWPGSGPGKGGGAATDFVHAHTKSGMGASASSGFVGTHF